MINIERVISKTPMVIADYFTEDGLLKQVGLVKEYWNRIVVKELTDNALDAIEPLQDKKVFMDVTSGSLGIYDNGTGIKKETVEDIYDFENYVSQNRNYITASRGKQGNGLKTIISICYIQGYRLLWHTAEGIILEANIDSEQLRYGRLEVSFVEIGVTDKRGIEIIGIGAVENFLYDYFIGYSKCNPDVSFYLNYFGEKIENLAKMEGIDKSKNISIAYYDYDSYQNFIIHTQDGNTTYKQFLDNVFGTRMKNKSNIKSKIKDIDFKSDEFIKDFLMLKEDQQTKKYTLLKKQLIGLENILTTTVEIVDNEAPKGMNDKVIPCIVEFSVKKDTFKNETAKKNSSIECYINNSITYRGAFSITFKSGWYKIGNKSKYGENLYDLLHDMSNFSFVFHIISPYLKYTDAGKTRIDVSSFWNEVLEKLNKTIAKENRRFSSKNKKVSDRGVMRSFVTDAFNMASDNGRYAITARQIWYKMREISGIEEKKNTYADFTQNILTEWIDENPEYEDKINFSDRGNFYVDGSQNGLGTANVRSFINSIGTAQNIFRCYGGISSNIHIEPDFDLRDKYPLFYDMTKAESAQITNNAVMNCLISSFQNENIGFVSNAITKIFNSEGDPDTKLVRVLCAYNNFVIDYFKTQKSMDLQQYTFIYEEYKDSDKHKCPHFFMYAKDKKQKQCEKSNLNGNADRISKYISDKTSNGIAKVNYSSKDAFNPEMLKNSDIKVDRTSEKYSQLRRLLLDLKREHSAWYKKVKDDLNAKESEKQLFNIYCGAKVKEIFPDRKEAANYLVDIEYHTEENQEEKKDILWNCYGDILYDNLCKNVDSDITPKVKRNVYQKSVDREKEILESRDRIKKEQEEIVKVLITKTVYDDLMGIKVRKGCEKDRYILYILYVLIRRFQAKYGEEKEYIRIYKGLRQKSKITAATIDNWIDSKCTQKGLDRLEKNKYIRREHMQNYDKVYLRELPETDVSDIVFDAESNNPLLDLWEYNGERKVAKCEICNKKFVVVGNTKTCSDKCSKVLVKRNKNKTS